MALRFAALRLSFWIMAAIFHDCHSTRSCTLNFLRCCFAFVSYFSTHSQAIDRIHAARTSLLCCLVTVVSLQRKRNRSLYFVDHMPWSKCRFWWESNFQVTDAFPEHACVETSLVISTQTFSKIVEKKLFTSVRKTKWRFGILENRTYASATIPLMAVTAHDFNACQSTCCLALSRTVDPSLQITPCFGNNLKNPTLLW